MGKEQNKHIVNEAIGYMQRHICEELTLEMIAEHCHLSKFYFSRMFKEETGESVYAFIKRIRMQQSAFRLKVERERSVTDIGMDYGYTSSNYSTIFRSVLKESPTDFRHSHEHKKNQEKFEKIASKIRIENIPDCKVIYERAIGNYNEIANKWDWFMKKYEPYITKQTVFYESTFDDPTIADADHCIFDIYMTFTEGYEKQNVMLLKGGKYVVYPFKGYLEEIYAVSQDIRNIWLPYSHFQLDERLTFDRYSYVDCSNERKYLEFDICIPIK